MAFIRERYQRVRDVINDESKDSWWLMETVLYKLAKWITPCYRDEQFNACALRSGNAALPQIVKGDRKLKLPVLDPMLIPALDIDSSDSNLGLDIKMRNIKIMGLKNSKIEKINIDFAKKHISFTATIPRFVLLNTYNISGRVLILPIVGMGPGNITLSGLRVTYDANYDLPVRSGLEHLALRDDVLKFTAQHAVIRLDNLFNGDKLLGNQMNVFLNENWRDLVAEIGPAIGSALGQVMTQVIMLMADQVPYKDIVLVRPK